MPLTKQDYNTIRGWIARNARLLDYARFRFHFEGGSKEEVLNALAAYQNADGGFGHALEPDNWNPNSSPLTTSTAINLLAEIGYFAREHAVVRGIEQYLLNTKSWDAVIPSNNDHAHAPWWTYSEEAVKGWGLNPALLVAIFASGNAELKARAQKVFEAAQKALKENAVIDPHQAQCFVAYTGYLAQTQSRDLSQVYPAVKKIVDQSICRQPEKYFTEYVTRPSFFIMGGDSPYLAGNEKEMDAELEGILNHRNADGVWEVTWRWAGYDSEFAVSANWWKSGMAIQNLLLLKSFKKTEF